MNKSLKALSILLLSATMTFAQQNVGIGTLTPNPKAMLEIKSTDKGLLLPRMTTAQRVAMTLVSTDEGLIVYDSDSSLFFFWNGTRWKHYPDLADGWNLTSNNTNLHSAVSGNVGIGTTTPQAKLHTFGTLRFQGLGNTTSFTDVLTVDASGNVMKRSLDPGIWNGDDVNDADSNPLNECNSSIIYDITKQKLFIVDACGTDSTSIPTDPNDNDKSATNELQNLSSTTAGANVTVNISSGTGTTFSINDADALPTNEAQTLSISKSGINVTWNLTSVSGTGGGSGTFDVDDNDWDGGGTGSMYPTTITDNVGIGTTTPGHKLDVSGDIRTSGSVYFASANNYYIRKSVTDLLMYSNDNIKLQTNNDHIITFYESGAEAIANFNLDGQDVMTWRGTGSYSYSVGIGTTTPANKLQVAGDVRIGLINPAGFSGTDYGNLLYFSGGTGYIGFDSDNDDLLFMSRYNNGADDSELRIGIGDDAGQSSNTDRLSIGSLSSGGNVSTFSGLFDFEIENPNTNSSGPMLSIGTAHVKDYYGGLSITKPIGANGQYINLARGTSSTVWSIGYQYGTNRFAINEGNNTNDAAFALTPQFTIIPGGNVGLGVAAPQYQLELSTDNAAKPGSSTWIVTSDARLKKDVKPFGDGLAVVKQINPVKFHYNGLAGMPVNKEYVGIIAQDIQKVAPYMVGEWKYEDKDGKTESYLNYDANAMTYILINAIKEQQEQIEQLKKQNTLILSEVQELKSGGSTARK